MHKLCCVQIRRLAHVSSRLCALVSKEQNNADGRMEDDVWALGEQVRREVLAALNEFESQIRPSQSPTISRKRGCKSRKSSRAAAAAVSTGAL